VKRIWHKVMDQISEILESGVLITDDFENSILMDELRRHPDESNESVKHSSVAVEPAKKKTPAK